jgi:hypothetical protein
MARVTLALALLFFTFPPLAGQSAWAGPGIAPWTSEAGFQQLVYGASSPWDVQSAIGRPADEVLRFEQMYPIIENHYYYDENKSGAATIFVFENNFLVGMHFKSADNQMIDLTYFLPNNGDYSRNFQTYGGGYAGYFPGFGLYGF